MSVEARATAEQEQADAQQEVLSKTPLTIYMG